MGHAWTDLLWNPAHLIRPGDLFLLEGEALAYFLPACLVQALHEPRGSFLADVLAIVRRRPGSPLAGRQAEVADAALAYFASGHS